MKPLLLALTLALALLAGCADDAGPAEIGGTAGEDGQPGTGADGTGDGADPGDADAAAATGTPTTTPFSKDGQTALGGCAYAMGVGQCQWVFANNFLELSFDGDAQAVRGTMTFQPVPGYPMAIFLLVEEGDGWTWREGMPMESGDTGTLAFDWSVARYDGGLALVASSFTWVGAVVGGAGASVPFDFHLEGEVEALT